jgi:putative cardiolipin synthase
MQKTAKHFHKLIVLLFLTALGGCANLPPNTDRNESHAYLETQDTALGRTYRRASAGHAGESGFYPLANGLDAFVARAVLAYVAERSIDTQYYMIHDDVVGQLFIGALYKAAERGVRVRILIDDIDQGGKDSQTAILDMHPNIEVRIFNPFGRNTGRAPQLLTGFGKQTRRAHNKSFTIDNQVTILGGRNIGDEYFNADPDMAFADMDVISVGPVARDVSASFDLYWNHELSYPIATLVQELPTDDEVAEGAQQFEKNLVQHENSEYMQYLRESDLANRLRQDNVEYFWGVGQVVADDPAKLTEDTSNTEYRLMEQLEPYLEGIETDFIIFSPYFVPGKSGVTFFQALRDKGVRVRILTNSLSSTDVAAVHAGYSKYRKPLLRMGVELYELNMQLSAEQRQAMKNEGIGDSKASLHAKLFVLDRNQVFIGSLNLDPRSVVQNTEIGVVFESPEIAELIAYGFESKIEQIAFRVELQRDDRGHEEMVWHGLIDGTQQTVSKDPYTGFWKRFGVGFMKLFPIESQL